MPSGNPDSRWRDFQHPPSHDTLSESINTSLIVQHNTGGSAPRDVSRAASSNSHQHQQQPRQRRGEANSYFDSGQSFPTDYASEASSNPTSRRRHRSHHSREDGHHSATPHPPHRYRQHHHPLPQQLQEHDRLRSSSLSPGLLGTLKGMWDLARKKPHVQEDLKQDIHNAIVAYGSIEGQKLEWEEKHGETCVVYDKYQRGESRFNLSGRKK